MRYKFFDEISLRFHSGELGCNADLLKLLHGSDPRVAMAGDVFVTSYLKPVCGLLGGVVHNKPAIFRAILGFNYYISAGFLFKDSIARNQEIEKLLNISNENDTKVGEAETPDPKPESYNKYNSEFLRKNCLKSLTTGNLSLLSAVYLAVEAYKQGAASVDNFESTFSDLLKKDSVGDLKVVPKAFGVESVDELLVSRSKNRNNNLFHNILYVIFIFY